MKQAIARLEQQVVYGTVATTASTSEPRRAQIDYYHHLDQIDSWSGVKFVECVKYIIHELHHCHDPEIYIEDIRKIGFFWWVMCGFCDLLNDKYFLLKGRSSQDDKRTFLYIFRDFETAFNFQIRAKNPDRK